MFASPIGFDAVMASFLIITLIIVFSYEEIPKNSTPSVGTIFIVFIAILLMGLAPATADIGTDRPNYADMFFHVDAQLQRGFRDVGFSYFLKLCEITTGSVTGFFLISACIYIIASVYFYKKACPSKYIYMVLLCFLSLGFTNHYYNVLRSGLCISFLLIAISRNQKMWKTIVFSLLSISFHKSGILVVLGYLMTYKLKNTKLLYVFWGGMLVMLLAGFFDSFAQYTELFKNIDDIRVNQYLSGNDLGYKVGLRLDFITYSLFPIFVGWYYIFKRKFSDKYYVHIYNTYLFCNSCWLVFSKMPHNDRLAYLSWFLIPYILLYPLLCEPKEGNVIKNKKLLLAFFMIVIVGLNFYLKYMR